MLTTAQKLMLFGGAWTPARLFRGGDAGLWLDPSDTSTLYQDSAGTTAGVLTQPLGKVNDKSGNGNHVTQGTAPNRPTWQQLAAGWYGARADGTDDSLASTTGGGGTTGILICAAITVNGGAGTVRYIWSDRNALAGYLVLASTGNKLQFIAGNGAAQTNLLTAEDLAVGTTSVITCWDDGVNLNAQINNGVVASVARPAVAAGTASFTLAKHNTANSDYLSADYHQFVYVKNTAKTATEREKLKQYVARKAGVSL